VARGAPIPSKVRISSAFRKFAVDQDGVRTGQPVRFGSPQCSSMLQNGDQCFDSRDDRKVWGRSGCPCQRLSCRRTPDIGQRLAFPVQETVGFGKLLVLNADARNPALFELAHQAPHVVEIAVARIAVEQDRRSLASAMNSSMSTTCVQLASLLSRTPN